MKSIHSANCFNRNFVKNLVPAVSNLLDNIVTNRKLVLKDMLTSLLLAVFFISKSVLIGAFECHKISSAANLHRVELDYSINLLQGRACRIIETKILLQLSLRNNLQACIMLFKHPFVAPNNLFSKHLSVVNSPKSIIK